MKLNILSMHKVYSNQFFVLSLHVSFLAFGFMNCQTPTRNIGVDTTPVETSETSQTISAYSFQSITGLDSSDYVLIYPYQTSQRRDEYDLSSSGTPNTIGYWNLIFYNPNTQEQHLLIKNQVVSILEVLPNIDNFALNPQASRYIFYRIVTEDYNQDKKLTIQDPVYLFASDREGKNLRQLSPKGETLYQWQIPQHNHWLFITTLQDTNKDKVFTNTDKIKLYQMDLREDNPTLVPVFSTPFVQEIQNTYQRLYPEKK